MLNRRSLLTGLAAVFVAPAIIRTPGLLMPVRAQKVIPYRPLEMWVPAKWFTMTITSSGSLNIGDKMSIPGFGDMFVVAVSNANCATVAVI